MKAVCFATTKHGNLCLNTSNDKSGKCGRHGGLSKKAMDNIRAMKIMGYEADGDVIMA